MLYSKKVYIKYGIPKVLINQFTNLDLKNCFESLNFQGARFIKLKISNKTVYNRYF